MVAVTLDGKACSLELPPDCLSVAQATSYAKTKLGAVWVDACPSVGGDKPIIGPVGYMELKTYLDAVRAQFSGAGTKTRLFLSLAGWQPDGTVAEGASVLLPGKYIFNGSQPTADELPASLLHCGVLQLRAFTPQGSQVTVNLPDGRSTKMPVWESTRGADVISHVAALLRHVTAAWHVWHPTGGLLGYKERIIPGRQFNARLDPRPGPDDQEIYVNTLMGKKIAVRISLSSLAEELKLAITGKEGIPVDKQRIKYKSRQLEDTRTLASHGIKDGDVLYLESRQGGSMFVNSSGRCGDVGEQGLAADSEQVAAIIAAGGVPVEVVLPDCSSVLLPCKKDDSQQAILAALREHLHASAVDAVLAADVDAMQDPAALRKMLRQAQAAQRQP